MANYLDTLKEEKIDFSLNRIKKILAKLNNFHNKLKIIHVAGTNGKGSVSSLIANILKNSDYKVGVYSSPHLFDIRERVVINNTKISKEDFEFFSKFVEELQYKLKIKLTYFEFLTVIALKYFYNKKVDIAVIECGLGGRLDATNVFDKPLISIITNISLDHVEYLGKSKELILKEKMFILREKVPIVSGIKEKKLKAVLLKQALNLKSDLFLEFEDFVFNSKVYKDKDYVLKGIDTQLLGDHQYHNIALAVKSCLLLRTKGFNIVKENIRKGIFETYIPGRLEFIKASSLGLPFDSLFDVAHNEASIKSFLKYFKKIKKIYSKNILVFGILKDKNFKSIIKYLSSDFDKIYLTELSSKRTLDINTLRQEFLKYREEKDIFSYKHNNDIIKVLCDKYSSKSLINFIGSFYLISNFKRKTI